MAHETFLKGGLKLPTTIASGAGHEILTLSPSGLVGKIAAIDTSTFISTSLSSGSILVGSAGNIAQPVVVSGDATISNLGALTIANDAITNVKVSSIAAIALSKLATLTASRALVSDGSGVISASSVTSTELGFLSGVTSGIQTQINGKLSATITGAAAGDLLYFNGTSWVNFPKGTTNYALISTVGGIGWADITPPAIPLAGTADQILAKVDGTDYNTYWMSLSLSKILDVTATAAEVNILAGQTITGTELSYLAGVSSNIQSQLNSKQDTITGAASTVVTSNLTADRAVYSNGSGKLTASTVTLTELNYLSGVSGSIQTQLVNKLDKALSAGALWTGNVSNVPTEVAPGTNGHVLTMVSGSPAWAAAPGGGGATWGAITGTLASQTDLQAALDAKVPTSRQLTINGVAFDLTADRSWTIPTVTGSGTINELTYWTGASSIGTLSLATYPSLTEISYVKGVTSAIQTQLNTKWNNTGTTTLTGNNIIAGAFDVNFTNTTVSFDQNNLRIWNPAKTFNYTIQASAILANRTITIPNIGNNRIMMLSSSATSPRIPYWNTANELSNTAGFEFSGISFTTPDINVTTGVATFSRGTSAGEIRILEPSGSGTNYTAFTVAAQSTNITYTLPTAVPTSDGQILSSTATGIMSWTARSRELTTASILTEYTSSVADNYKAVCIPTNSSYGGGSAITTINVGTTGIGQAFPANSLLLIKVTYSGVQTSGTAGSTGYTYTFQSVWRQTSSGTVTQVGSTAYQLQVNDTGDTFLTVPNVIFTAGSLALTRNLSTTKTFKELCYVEAYYVK